MKKILDNPSFFGFMVAFLVAVGGMAYYLYFIKKENFYYLDNPTNNSISVFLDSKNYELLPQTFTKIQLKKGKHDIKITNGAEKLDTFFYVNDVNGVINPSLSDYYIYKKFYGFRTNKDSIVDALPKTTIDSKEYRGEIIHCHDLNIEGFDYGLDENFPKVIQKDSINDRTKVYRKSDFVNNYPNLE